jgi:hypothetical protein
LARHFPSNYTGKLIKQDPNQALELDSFKCRMPNDFVDWNTLSSDVKKKQLTKEELDAYYEGKFIIDGIHQSKRQHGLYDQRSQLGNHIAGSGIIRAFYEPEEMYEDKKIKPHEVRFSSDPQDGDYDRLCKALSGKVITTKIGGKNDGK